MRYTILLLVQFFCLSLMAQSAEVKNALEPVVAEIVEVEANGKTIEQKLFPLDAENSDELVLLITTTEKNDKSSEERFEFNPIDLDSRLLSREVKSKVMFLSVKTDDNQRMIKYFEDGEQGNYSNNFFIAVNDAEAYRRLSDLFDALIKAAKDVEKTDISNMDFAQQIQFLQDNIVTVKSGGDVYEQKMSISDPAYLVQLSTKLSTEKETESFEAKFNLADLQEKSVKINTSGKKLSVELGTQNNKRWIQNYEEGAFENYGNSIEILVNTTNEARNILSVIKQLIPSARKMEKEHMESMAGGASQSSAKVRENVKDITEGKDQYRQKLEGDNCILELTQELMEDKGETTKDSYLFNLIDFNKKSVSIDAGSSSLSVEIKSDNKMVQYLRNGELQNYRNTVNFYVTEVEAAKTLSFLLEEQIAACATEAKENSRSGESKEQLFAAATALILDVELPGYSYLQKLETEEGETCKLQFTQTRSTKSKDTQLLYDFSLSDINPKTIDFSISGRNLSLELVTNNREKVIKEYEGSEKSDYTDRIQIYMNDLEKTRTLIALLNELTAQCSEDRN